MPDLLTPSRLAEIRELAGDVGEAVVEVSYGAHRHADFRSLLGGARWYVISHGDVTDAERRLMRHSFTVIPALLSHIDAMREVLESVEQGATIPVMTGQKTVWHGGCPCRRGTVEEGHAPGCRLAAALGKGVGA